MGSTSYALISKLNKFDNKSWNPVFPIGFAIGKRKKQNKQKKNIIYFIDLAIGIKFYIFSVLKK